MKEQRIINFGWRANLYRNERRMNLYGNPDFVGIDDHFAKVQKNQNKAARILAELKTLNPKSKDESERSNYIRLRGIYNSLVGQAVKVRDRAVQEWRRIVAESNRFAIDPEETAAMEYFLAHEHMLAEDSQE